VGGDKVTGRRIKVTLVIKAAISIQEIQGRKKGPPAEMLRREEKSRTPSSTQRKKEAYKKN